MGRTIAPRRSGTILRRPTGEPQPTLGGVTDPAQVARCRDQDERARRNSAWLQAQWPALPPRAHGKFVAVAGQEAFIADTAHEAWGMARAAGPQDDRAINQYVFPQGGPRIYAYRW